MTPRRALRADEDEPAAARIDGCRAETESFEDMVRVEGV